jgi:hypothetical protein
MPWKLVALITPSDTIPVNGENISLKEIDTVKLHEDGRITFEKQVTVKESQKSEWKLAEPVG